MLWWVPSPLPPVCSCAHVDPLMVHHVHHEIYGAICEECVFACLLLRGRCECEWVERSLVYLFIQFSRLAQWTYLTRKSNMMMPTWLCTHAGSVRCACYEKVCITWWFCSKHWAGGQAGSSFYFNLILSLCLKPPNWNPANETRAPQWVRGIFGGGTDVTAYMYQIGFAKPTTLYRPATVWLAGCDWASMVVVLRAY